MMVVLLWTYFSFFFFFFQDKENDEKEDKLVAARNEENAKVSGMKDDGPGDKRRTYMPGVHPIHLSVNSMDVTRNVSLLYLLMSL